MYRTIRLWGLSTCKGTHFWRQRMHIAPAFYTIGTLFRSNRESGREIGGMSVRHPPHPFAPENAVRCDARCSALHRPVQRAA